MTPEGTAGRIPMTGPAGQKKFREYCQAQRRVREEFLDRHLAYPQAPGQYDPVIASCYTDLAVICRLQGDMAKSRALLDCYRGYGTSREKTAFFREYTEIEAEQAAFVSYILRWGYLFCHLGISESIAKGDRNQARHFFESAVSCCTLNKSYTATRNDSYGLMRIAFSCLWKGYALVCLGRYSEAHPILLKVAPMYRAVRIGSTRDSRASAVIEPALAKVLVPLCEYHRMPTRTSHRAAMDGMEQFHSLLYDPMFRLRGYLYDFHLQDLFSGIFSSDPAGLSDRAPEQYRCPPAPAPISVTAENNCRGSVYIWDPEIGHRREYLGSNADFATFIRYIETLGTFPVLASMIDHYTTGQCQAAQPVAAECIRLEGLQGIDPAILGIVRKIHGVCRDAAEADSVILPDYDPYTSHGPDFSLSS